MLEIIETQGRFRFFEDHALFEGVNSKVLVEYPVHRHRTALGKVLIEAALLPETALEVFGYVITSENGVESFAVFHGVDGLFVPDEGMPGMEPTAAPTVEVIK